MASTTSPTTSSISCWRGCPTRRRARAGISLFLVPKFLLNADGSPGARNDVRAHSIEHKLGIHASPTCTMVFGDKGGATGFLVGEENRGMACMFTMMNQARLVGRPAGRRASPSARPSRRSPMRASASRAARPARSDGIEPDHRASRRQAHAAHHARADRAPRARSATPPRSRSIAPQRSPDEARAQAAHERASLLTPVAKAFSTDIGIEVASLGVQVHGGMGYIEETGAAQHYRDARIAAIYEGTNGIQAIDLVTRKLPLSGGARGAAPISRELRRTVEAVKAANDPAFGATGARLAEAVDCLERATALAARPAAERPDAALAGATPYLRLFALAAGGALLAERGAGGAAHRRRRHRRRRPASRWRGSSRRISRSRPAASSAP